MKASARLRGARFVVRSWGIRHWMIAASVSLLLVWLPPAWGQSPSPISVPNPARALEVPSVLDTSDAPDVSTEDVRLDGRRLFAIAAPAVSGKSRQSSDTPPIQERANQIEQTLNRIANSEFDPKTLQVTSVVDSESRLPVIYIGVDEALPEQERYLMTVTTLDAQLQGQSPEQRADDLTQIIRQALLSARQERRPEFLTRQGLSAAQILLGMVITGWLVDMRQRHLKARRDRYHSQLATLQPPTEIDALQDPANSSPTATILTVQEQMNQRQQRNINDIRQRLLQLLQVFIWGGGSFVLLGLFPYTRWLQSLLFSGPLKVLGIVLITYVAIRMSDILIDRFFSALTEEELLAPNTSQRLALRVSTFSRVLRSVVSIVLIGVAILSILSAIGVQLVPVLAGAGILGLAVSFASQNLIKDIINGLLILSEDQYAVGDVIQIGKASGLVEYMNLRITQLRNAEGRLITIPNSTITVVENLSKDWSRVDLALTIAYDSNTSTAFDVIKQVGEDLCQDPVWRSKIPEPPEVLGIDEISNAGVTIRVWIKTLPLQQWNVAREFRRRLKSALDKQGIAIGLPQQSLWFHSSLNLNNRAFDADGQMPSDKQGVPD